MLNLFSRLIAGLGPNGMIILLIGAFLFLLLICISSAFEERFCRFLYDVLYILRTKRLPRRRYKKRVK